MPIQEHDTSCSGASASLALEPFHERVTLPPRIARRLRLRAFDNGRTPTVEASLILSAVLVPELSQRKRLARLDLTEALGEEASR